MKIASLTTDEDERIRTLHTYNILDSEPEKEYEDLVRIASQICQVPVALISLVDTNRQWFKACVGMDAAETTRDLAFCSHAILQSHVLVIEDARLDFRFADHPFVTDAPFVRFYAGAPLRSPSGHNLGTICVVDYIPRQLTKEQLESLEALSRQVVKLMELRRRVAELDRSRRELEMSEAAQRKASRAKSDFLGNMSHEIRTPLNGIMGMTQILLELRISKEQEEQLRLVYGSSESLLRIVNEILDFSRLDAGTVELGDESIDMRILLKGVANLFEPLARQKGLNLICDLNRLHHPSVKGDADRIRQVFSNLVGNAVKFTQKGSVTISAQSSSRLGKSELLIAVRDTGPGIPESMELFQPFMQADTSTTRRFEGAGLGLAICKALCDRMGGRIWLERSLGSIFHVQLNLTIDTNPGIIEKPEKATRSMAVDYPQRILVAEDNSTNQKVILGLLEKLGYQADLAEDGAQVLLELSEKEYDLIIMDCHMPVMDGFEATEKILKSFQGKKRPRIIAMTAAAFEEDRKRCLAVGMDDFCSKPVSMQSLMNALRPQQKAS